MLLRLLLAALLAGSAASAPLPGNATKEVLISSSLRYLSSAGVQLSGGALLASSQATAEVCAQKCFDAGPICGWFTTTCDAAQACRCDLFSANCSLAPSYSNKTAEAGGTVTSGVPLRYELPDLDIYAAVDGQAVLNADLPECPGSQLPGMCGFNTLMDAGRTCPRIKECAGINVFWNGTNGCGPAAFVLTSQAPAGNNTFVSPVVSAYSTRGSPEDVVLSASEAAVIPPTLAETQAAASAADPDSAWLGCIIAPHTIMSGTLVQVLENVPTSQACCRACRAKGSATANVWNYCAETGGCLYTLKDGRTVNMRAGQCELRYNLATNLAMGGFPPTVVTKDPQVPVVGGAPMAVAAAEMPGYSALLGTIMYSNAGSFSCSETMRPVLIDECWLDGSIQQLGEMCTDIPECTALVVKPGWLGLPEPQTIGVAKNTTSLDLQFLSPTSVLYVNNTRLQGLAGGTGSGSSSSSGSSSGSDSGGSQPGSSSGSSLSSGAIAGIAVGATVAALAAALGGWALLRRRQQRQRTASGAGASEEGAKAAADGGAVPEALSWSSSQPPGPGSSGRTQAAGSGGAAAAAAAAVAPVTAASPTDTPFQVERGFTLRTRTAVSPFAASPFAALGANPGKMHVNTAARPAIAASPFAAARNNSGRAAGKPTSASPAAARVTSPLAIAQQGSPQFPGSTSGQSVSLAQNTQGSATSWGLASLAGIAAPVPEDDPHTAGSSDETASASASGSACILPELQAHVAAMDAGMSVDSALAGHDGAHVGGELLTELSLLAPASLPEALRDVLVDLSELQPLRWPNGALQELGSGGSATVYKVLFRGEAVAAKEMEVGRDLSNQRAFIAEAERLHALRHAHLVPLYGVCLSGSKGILLMEFCAGRDLHSALAVKKQGGCGERLFGWYARGWQVALDVAKALNYLHSRSIVHLDIKSSNVLLTATGTAKLGDVGLARMQRGTALSCAPKAVGTFDYMAPEMITNSRCTLAVDLFSMGILIWEICTGERPRRGDMRLPHVPEECPQEVADLISQCMAVDAAERPTAQQLMKRLQKMHTANGHKPASPAASMSVTMQRLASAAAAAKSQNQNTQQSQPIAAAAAGSLSMQQPAPSAATAANGPGNGAGAAPAQEER